MAMAMKSFYLVDDKSFFRLYFLANIYDMRFRFTDFFIFFFMSPSAYHRQA